MPFVSIVCPPILSSICKRSTRCSMISSCLGVSKVSTISNISTIPTNIKSTKCCCTSSSSTICWGYKFSRTVLSTITCPPSKSSIVTSTTIFIRSNSSIPSSCLCCIIRIIIKEVWINIIWCVLNYIQYITFAIRI